MYLKSIILTQKYAELFKFNINDYYLNNNPRIKSCMGIDLSDLCLTIPEIQLHDSLMDFMLTVHWISRYFTTGRIISTLIWTI